MASSGALCDLIRTSPWLMGVLAVVRESGLPDAWVGAGVLRDLVWGTRYGSGFEPARPNGGRASR